MSKSKLSRVLTIFEESRGSLTLPDIAQELDITPARLEGMIQYWVHKGKLRVATSFADCGSCGRYEEGCPFVYELPRSYELVAEDKLPLCSLPTSNCQCERKT